MEEVEHKVMIDDENKTETIAQQLIQLGSYFGNFSTEKKSLCHNLLNDILNEAKSNDDRSTIQNILTSVATESYVIT